MKLGLKIPKHHLNDLRKYSDIIFLSPGDKVDDLPTDKEIWVVDDGCGPQELISYLLYKLEGRANFIVPNLITKTPRDIEWNIRLILDLFNKESISFCGGIVGTWWGFKKDLIYLKQISDLIALPWERPRTILFTPTEIGDYHYQGFRSLDELRIYTPRSLTTDMPIRAAVNLVSLETRERRPNLPTLDPDIKLSDAQLEEVVKNITLIRKAARGLL